MKDYSNFIQTGYGFITKYEIVDNQLLVYTTASEKGEPHIYTVNKENIGYIDERLGNQYKLILKNRKLIKQDFLKKRCKPINTGALVLSVLLVLAGGCTSYIWGVGLPLLLSFLFGAFVYTGSFFVTSHMEQKFDNELDLYEDYINQMEEIAKKRQEDLNVTRYLSFNAACKIKEKDQLKDSGLIDIPFNIDLMDKMKLKDLKKLLMNYYICEDLKQQQTFVVPDEYKSKTKKKTTNSK